MSGNIAGSQFSKARPAQTSHCSQFHLHLMLVDFVFWPYLALRIFCVEGHIVWYKIHLPNKWIFKDDFVAVNVGKGKLKCLVHHFE